MSKPPKTDFKALIAGHVAPAAESEPAEAAPAVEPAPVETVQERREVVSLKTRSVQQPAKAKAGEGTLKERAHQLSVYLEGPVFEQLREIAHVERTKVHPLILEAIDLLLKKRGAPSIKELIKRAS